MQKRFRLIPTKGLTMSILTDLAGKGQAVWFDYIRRSILTSGELAALVAQGVRGVTSNPTIFEKAIAGSDDYAEELALLARQGCGVEEIYETLAVRDIALAADLLLPVHQSTGGEDGFVSLEVSPRLAADTEGTIAEAKRLFRLLARPNVMIKVPATPAGIPAFEALIAAGVNVNVTLIFSLAQYEAVVGAYLAGLERRASAGEPVSGISSVASFFVSRLDSALDPRLAQLGEKELLGRIAVDNARLAYARFGILFSGPRWERLRELGARVQRPLWASTGTKNAAYPDTLYVDTLIGPHTVNTMPPATLDAYLDHGKVADTIGLDVEGARKRFARLAEVGIDLSEVTGRLLDDGVASFAQSFEALLASVALKRRQLLADRVQWEETLGALAPAVDAAARDLDADRRMDRLLAHDHTLWNPSPKEIDNRLGWLTVHPTVRGRVLALGRLRAALMTEGITGALLLGMGGSSLAPEVFSTAFPGLPDSLTLTVVDTTVPGAVLAAERAHDPKATLYIVSTKSGGTVETLSLFKYFHAQAVERLGRAEAGRRFIAITDPGSDLERWAAEQGFREVFLNDPNIGGRYAALSLVGLVPAALLGVDLDRLLDRADDARADLAPARRLAAVLAGAWREGRDKLTLVCSRAVSGLADWAEQLVAESTGKDGKGILPVVGEPLGPPEVYGNDRLFVAVLLNGDREFDAALDALAAAGHPVARLSLADRYDLGAQFYTWTVATALAGSLLGIHPFNQPDVESAKEEGRAMLERFRKTGRMGDLAPAWSGLGVDAFGEGIGADAASAAQVLARFLAGAAPGDYVALQAYAARNAAVDAALEALRLRLRAETRCAVTVGYGPRFLHSTGQLHKGDAGRGRFVQFTCDDPDDMMIPDAFGSPNGAVSFGMLKLAQAVGDARALAAKRRKVLRLHVKGDLAEELMRLAGA